MCRSGLSKRRNRMSKRKLGGLSMDPTDPTKSRRVQHQHGNVSETGHTPKTVVDYALREAR